MIAIVLFSDDFRIKDNPAFYNACLQYTQIIPVFIYNQNYTGRKLGEASCVFLHHVLKSFSNLLYHKYGGHLVIKKGNIIEELKKIIQETGAEKIFFNRSYTVKERETEALIVKNFNAESFKAKLLFEPSKIRKLKVFTPFWKECLRNIHLVQKPILPPSKVKIANSSSLNVEDLNLLPKQNWHINLANYWEFDYEKIENNTSDFLKTKLQNYKEDRNFPALNGASKFSPYIRFGVLSVNFLFWEAAGKSDFFASELGWREFAFASAFHLNKNLWEQEIRPEFSKFEFEENKNFFTKWRKGETGEELIDAGMHELYETGYMHNRVRMLTASYLIKDLLVSWKEGEAWFWNTLCDACPIVNPFSWQWVFGSGYDASPFFRIFNPDLQAEKFDPKKEYINFWNKTLAFKLVNHEQARKKAMEKYNLIKI